MSRPPSITWYPPRSDAAVALYAIGDIQGCHAELCQLLDLIGFSKDSDRLWLVGDLVNRGPESLEVLREVAALGDSASTVLGNHDFHLLTIAAGYRKPHRGDTLDAILAAPDRDELVDWLTRRPLVVCDGDHLLVHAGLLPQWTAAAAVALSREVEATLASDARRDFLGALYGDEPDRWRDDLIGYDRLRVIVNACTRMRFCAPDGRMALKEKRGPEHSPEGFRPWFAKFSGVLHDRRWLATVEDLYRWHHENERYLRGGEPLARVAIVYSETLRRAIACRICGTRLAAKYHGEWSVRRCRDVELLRTNAPAVAGNSRIQKS